VRGMVNYDAFARSAEFPRYLAALDPVRLGRDDQLAFWINAYNAYTIQLITKHNERASIRNINKTLGFVKAYGPWKEKLARVGGKAYGLDERHTGGRWVPGAFRRGLVPARLAQQSRRASPGVRRPRARVRAAERLPLCAALAVSSRPEASRARGGRSGARPAAPRHRRDRQPSLHEPAELESPLGAERVARCVFHVPISDRLVSMCEVNALGARERYYAEVDAGV
jgi:hypothetical protein